MSITCPKAMSRLKDTDLNQVHHIYAILKSGQHYQIFSRNLEYIYIETHAKVGHQEKNDQNRYHLPVYLSLQSTLHSHKTRKY